MPRYLYLTPMLGGPGAPRYPVTDQRQLIGRAEQSNIPLFEPTVSRRHASVRLEGDDVILQDLGSKHGTFVNSRRVTRAKLKVGDIVVFGLSLVLRLEESSTPVPPAEPLKVPSAVPTAIHSVDEQFITAVRESERKHACADEFESEEATDSVGLERLEDQLARSRKLAETGAICAAILPEATARLAELRRSLERSISEGVAEVDPYPILSSIESISEILEQLSEATRGRPEKLLSSKLRRVVAAAVGAVEPAASARGVSYLVEIPEEVKVQVDVPLLTQSLTWFLARAGRLSCEGKPVEILARFAQGQVVVTISHLGQPYPAAVGEPTDAPAAPDVRELERGFAEAREIVRSFGGQVTVDSKLGIGSTVRIILAAPIR